MKKIWLVILSSVMILTMGLDVFAGELNANEKNIIKSLEKSEYSAIEKRYVNQLENYFCTDEVQIGKSNADDFLLYLKEAITAKANSDKKKNFSNVSDTYIYFEKAGTALDLLLEYDSSVNDFYFINDSGYIVMDFQNVIKNTDDSDNKGWNISVEWIFAVVVLLCVLGMLVNLRRWNRKMKKHNSKRYEDEEEEEEDELEVANRKTRRARLQTFTYKNIKQVLRYCYIPIIMGLIVIGIGRISFSYFDEFMGSLKNNFINTQPLYYIDENLYQSANVKINEQPKSIALSDVTYPKYGEQYGQLKCDAIGVNAPVFFGDRGAYLESGAGTYSGSAIPGQEKTILIGAHDTTYFKGLEKVKKDQIFTFTTPYGIYEYQVTDTKIYDAGEYDKAYDLSTEKEQLVLYTCYPFGKLNGEKSERMFVYLDKVKGPNIER